jgi:hypothetical protein
MASHSSLTMGSSPGKWLRLSMILWTSDGRASNGMNRSQAPSQACTAAAMFGAVQIGRSAPATFVRSAQETIRIEARDKSTV